MGAPVVKRPVLPIFPENYQNPCRQALPFEADGCPRSGQLGNTIQSNGQLARVIGPAAFVLRLVRGTNAENPLPNRAL
jgi:hypothetical protein